MPTAEFLQEIQKIKIWKRGDQRAPHKPLLLLFMLAKLQRKEPRLFSYRELEPRLAELLNTYGPPRKVIHPEHPFWRLQNDGSFWEIPARASLLSSLNSSGDISGATLRKKNVYAGFSEIVYQKFSENPAWVNQIVSELLEAHFPTSFHEDILDTIGMPWVPVSVSRRRDPRFREMVLRIYEHCCAICGYNGKLGHSDLGLEAAHIKWHASGGPDIPENSLALCVFHHKVFDRGALGIDENYQILVSQKVHGQTGTDEWLYRFIGKPIRAPKSGQPLPRAEFLMWHRKEVFQDPARIS